MSTDDLLTQWSLSKIHLTVGEMIPEGHRYSVKADSLEKVRTMAAATCIPVSQLGAAAVRYLLGSMKSRDRWSAVLAYHGSIEWKQSSEQVQLDTSSAEHQILEMLAAVLERERVAGGDQKKFAITPSSIVGCAFQEFATYMKRRREHLERTRHPKSIEKGIAGDELEFFANLKVTRPTPLVVANVRQLQEAVELSALRRATAWIKRSDGALICSRCTFKLESAADVGADIRMVIELGFRKAHQASCAAAEEKPRPPKKKGAR